MKKIKKALNYFTVKEKLLWLISVSVILISFVVFESNDYLTLSASLIGVTSLIFNAKGNPIGQALMIVFSLIYGYISLTFNYYGEMITYVGMTAPMAAAALISWIKHPFENKKSEVKVDKLKNRDWIIMTVSACIITLFFYFVLKYFNTTNLLLSTVSVTTSFAAVYLTYKRSPLYALGYAANDIVLIALWTLASFENKSYISVTVCFVMFFFNDIYGYINWRKMEKRQSEIKKISA